MRHRHTLLLVAAAAGLVAGGSVNASVLLDATWTQTIQGVALTVTNERTTCTNTDPAHVQQTISCPPRSGLFATGSASGTNYSVSLTLPLFSISQFTTGGIIPIHTVATLSGPQTVIGGNSAATADRGVDGKATVKIALHTKGSMLVAGMTTLLKIPLSVGKAGTFTGYLFVLGYNHYITVDFYAWTPHTLTFTGLTSKKAPLQTPTVVAMGSFNLSASGGGTVSLVSPSKISIDGPLTQRRTASFTTLKLSYLGEPSTPEPGTLLLLGAAVAALVLLGRRGPS